MGVIKVYGVKLSPFSKRVELALKIKGVEYEFVEEDLGNKSSELVVKYNPVHKKIPVLVHDGKPIAESLIIMEYIDETFQGPPLLPTHPYHRAHARFWAKFIDDKVVPALMAISTSQGEEEVEKAIKEAHEQLNYFEKEISGKKFFGGDNFGYVDVAGIILAYWLPVLQEAMVTEPMLTKENYPSIFTWSQNILDCDVFKDNLPPRDTMLSNFKTRFQASTLPK